MNKYIFRTSTAYVTNMEPEQRIQLPRNIWELEIGVEAESLDAALKIAEREYYDILVWQGVYENGVTYTLKLHKFFKD